jgi:hypothetical protein
MVMKKVKGLISEVKGLLMWKGFGVTTWKRHKKKAG